MIGNDRVMEEQHVTLSLLRAGPLDSMREGVERMLPKACLRLEISDPTGLGDAERRDLKLKFQESKLL